MSQHGGVKSAGVRTASRKRIAISFAIRDVEEWVNRAGVNTLCLDQTNQVLCTAGRDSIIRLWNVEDSEKGEIKVSTVYCTVRITPHEYNLGLCLFK